MGWENAILGLATEKFLHGLQVDVLPAGSTARMQAACPEIN